MMPSKKTSKNHSKFSSSGQTIGSSLSPVSISSPLGPTYDQLLSSLDEASAKFPSLVSRTAFAGTLVGDAISDSPGCKVWLSESVLLSYGIPPGSLVSVSLSSLEKGVNGFPLSSLSDECAREFGFELPSNFADEAGNFFALAIVFPSTKGVKCGKKETIKVIKNGVRLSLNLSYTMGCPTSGRTVFVYPIKCHPSVENGNGNQCGLATSCCKELYLSPVCLKGNFVQMSYLDSSKVVELGQVQDAKSSSPKTPSLSQSKLSSPCLAQSHTLNYDKLASKSTNYSHAPIDVLDIEHILGDDSSRRLMETCITSWLNSRILLSRNFVIVPILSGLCVFQVLGSREMLSRNDLTDQALDLRKDTLFAFPINSDMKICLLSQGNLMVQNSGRYSFVHPELKHLPDKSSMEMSLPKLGGLSKEFEELKDIIVSSAVHVTVTSLGLRPTKGVLIHGPPGTGKTTLARECARSVGVNMFSVNGPEIISQFHGETEQALHEVFNKASQASPSIVFIDELDAIAPARKDGGDELSQRMVATLLNLMDGINRHEGMLIIAVTNRPDSIEPALRRPGRLDLEIEIGVPSPRQRHDILVVLLSEMQHSLVDKDIQHLAMNTHGFVGADLAALCNEAALVCLRRYVKSTTSQCVSDFEVSTASFSSVFHTASKSQHVSLGNNLEDPQNLGDPENNYEACYPGTTETENSSCFNDGSRMKGAHDLKNILVITSKDFEKARIRVQPSAMREVSLEVPKVCWEDVGGQVEVKAQLMEAVQWPQKHRDAFERIGTRPPSGILLFGPPGCSKTLLARAVASEAGLNFLAVKGPELFSKWVGESEKAVRTLFAKARANAPSIIFFDEIDGLAIIRGKESDGVSVGDRVISQLLVELDGLQQRGSVTVIAATNRPDKIDPALLRPGRFDRLLYVGPPNRNDREDIFRVHLHRMPCNSDVCISELSPLTEGCTGADISLICREAALAAMEENLSASEITMKHLKVGLQQVQPTDVQMYEKLSTKFQRLVLSTAKEDDLGCEPSSSNPSHIPLWSRIKYAASSLFAFHG